MLDFLKEKKLGEEATDFLAVQKRFFTFFEQNLKSVSNPAKKTNNKSSKKTSIKSFLLQQNIVCGLGNIYVNESLKDSVAITSKSY